MNRDRSYYRRQRARHISRRRAICHFFRSHPMIYDKRVGFNTYDWSISIPFEWYTIKGRYSKGKIHCSCGLCRAKTNNKGRARTVHANYAPSKNWSIKDLRRLDEIKYEEEEYYER